MKTSERIQPSAKWDLVTAEIEHREARSTARSTSASRVALREGHGKTRDVTAELEAEFRRSGLSPEAARAAARGRGRVKESGSLIDAFKAGGLSERAARVAARGRHGLHEVVKNVAGLPASAFAWTPDPEDPTTWRMQLSRSADNGNGVWAPEEDLVRAAVAQLPGIAQYGDALDIPAADLPAVRATLRAAWIACGISLDDMPNELNQEALRREFLRGGLSAEAAAVAARGRQRRR
jgi:hypothetical protein